MEHLWFTPIKHCMPCSGNSQSPMLDAFDSCFSLLNQMVQRTAMPQVSLQCQSGNYQKPAQLGQHQQPTCQRQWQCCQREAKPLGKECNCTSQQACTWCCNQSMTSLNSALMLKESANSTIACQSLWVQNKMVQRAPFSF